MPAALLDDVHMQRWSLSGVQMRVWIDIGWLEVVGQFDHLLWRAEPDRGSEDSTA